jgi:hypothetical protein
MEDGTAVTGLLLKRGKLQRESASARQQMAVLSNSIEAIDRVLEAFDFEGELEGRTARGPKIVLFYRNELREYRLGELRKADWPLSSRELATRICQCEGRDAHDRRLVADVTRRVGCALRKMRAAHFVRGERDRGGTAVWSAARWP